MKIQFRFKKMCHFKIIFIILLLCIVYKVHITLYRRPEPSVVLENVVVHLDLKGAPPKLSYLQNVLLPMLKHLGVTGLLIEFEDMFPYNEKLGNIRAKNSYQSYRLFAFLVYARTKMGFEIIPLIQTFGHMEFVLKLKEYESLREKPRRVDSICPSQNESYNLIRDMLAQVIHFLKPLKYIHIGCDEVFNMNLCDKCQKRKLNNITLFADHVRNVKDIITSISPNTTVLIWDDMLRGRYLFEAENGVLGSNVELVHWNYGPHASHDRTNIHLYHRHFKNIWVASAFKGADGRTEIFPELHNRFLNHVSLLNLVKNYRNRYMNAFQGIILTGWSRYHHISPLCELMVTAIPSLYLNLIVIKNYKLGNTCCDGHDENDYFSKYIEEELREILECKNKIENVNFLIYNCTFKGYKLSQELKKYEILIKEFDLKYYEYQLPYIEYYAKVNSTILNIMYQTQEWCMQLLRGIIESEMRVSATMSKYYDRYVVEEYVNSKSFHIKTKLLQVLSILDRNL